MNLNIIVLVASVLSTHCTVDIVICDQGPTNPSTNRIFQPKLKIYHPPQNCDDSILIHNK